MSKRTTDTLASPTGRAGTSQGESVTTCEETARPRVADETRNSDHRLREVRESVFMLLQKTDQTEERRWKPRILFVQSAVILLEDEGSDQPDAETAGARPRSAQQTGCLSRVDVVTTDISTRGVGVLSPIELPKGLMVLRFSEVEFLCEALWSERVGEGFYRHGLKFNSAIGL